MPTLSKHYFEHGYALAKGVFRGEELSLLQNDFDRAVQQIISRTDSVQAMWQGSQTAGSPDSLMLHIHNIHQYSGAWLRALVNDRFVNLFQQLVGPDVVLHHTKLFQKPAVTGALLPLHQDWPIFPTYQNTMCAAIIHVSDATDAMGCLRVVPGTHKLGRIERSADPNAPTEAPFNFERSVPVEAKAGDVVFFNYLTIHGSKENVSPDPRKIVIVQAHAGNDEVERGVAHPNERLVLSGWNSGASHARAVTP